jgi:hypothetical protein
LKFRRETLIGYESRKCTQAVQDGLKLKAFQSNTNICFPPAYSSPLKTEDLPGSWPGLYMRMVTGQLLTTQSVRYHKYPPPSVLQPASRQARLHGVLGRKSMYVARSVVGDPWWLFYVVSPLNCCVHQH